MQTKKIPLSSLSPHPDNPRARNALHAAQVGDLMCSIREHGLLQPLVVRAEEEGYVILAGHRRYGALRALREEAAPCVVLDADEAESLAVLLTDNGQHQAVDPLKEADTVARLVESLAGEEHPYDRAATLVGKSPSWVRDRLRLRSLSAAWRMALSDAASPIHEWPIAHLEVIAALPETVQDQLLTDNESVFQEGVPLALDLRRLIAEYTRDLSQVPWDVEAEGVVPDAPACSACPRRDVCEGFLLREVTDTKKPRCLDAVCFQSKLEATIRGKVAEATAKHGDALAIERSWTYRDVVLPEDIPTFEEFQLVPTARAKGGFPVLRLKTLKVVMMAQASKGVEPSMDGKPARKSGPRSMADRRKELEKRRRVRALTLLCGSIADRPVQIGTKASPHEITPPPLGLPPLDGLVGLVLGVGTGGHGQIHPDGGKASRAALEALLARGRSSDASEAEATRRDLWDALRSTLVKTLQPHPGISPNSVEARVGIAEVVCGVCGTDWTATFLKPATDAIKTPKAWASKRAS